MSSFIHSTNIYQVLLCISDVLLLDKCGELHRSLCPLGAHRLVCYINIKETSTHCKGETSFYADVENKEIEANSLGYVVRGDLPEVLS